MKKKSLYRRIENKISKIIRNIKYRNVKWCFDEQECANTSKDCKSCDYCTDYDK